MPSTLWVRHIFCLTQKIFKLMAMQTMTMLQPEVYHFEDDGIIPNNKLPLLLYRDAFPQRGNAGAEWLEQQFAENGWTNSWRWTIYGYHHYHSNTHEVLGVFNGSAVLRFGGENGQQLTVHAGDIIVIPAGVAHKKISDDHLAVVGAYPDGMIPDLHKEGENGREAAVKQIAAVPIPDKDPLLGEDDGLRRMWQ
jgi:uncharacterized protein YjlB